MTNILDVIRSGDYLVLDTETTGLDASAEICQIAIIDSAAKVLLDTLVKPVHPIPAEATAIHGITNEMVKDANPLPYKMIRDLLNGKSVIVYNASFDVDMLQQSTHFLLNESLYFRWVHTADWYCAMLEFARIYGEWDARRKSYKWKKLDLAASYYHIPITDAHNALADCLTTLEVCKAMVGTLPIKFDGQGKLPF